jgi:hypothetical protein
MVRLEHRQRQQFAAGGVASALSCSGARQCRQAVPE